MSATFEMWDVPQTTAQTLPELDLSSDVHLLHPTPPEPVEAQADPRRDNDPAKTTTTPLHATVLQHLSSWLAGLMQSDRSSLRTLSARVQRARTPADLRLAVLTFYRDLARPRSVELCDALTRPSDDKVCQIPLILSGRTIAALRVGLTGKRPLDRGLLCRLERMAPLAAAVLAASEARPRAVPMPMMPCRNAAGPDLARSPVTDDATGLPDADYFDAALQNALKARGPLSLVLIEPIDIQHVRIIQGAVYADAAMARVARAVVGTLRTTDPVARLDENRLAAILPGADAAGVARVVQALGRAITEAGLTSSTPQPLTARIGAATAPDDGNSPQALMTRAENALLRAC